MVLIKNKRGIFFTTIVIIILILFITTFSFYSENKERKSTQKRIETLNNFIFSIEEDIPRQLYASGFRIIFLLEKNIIETGSYITNLNSAAQELFFNGTLYGGINPDIQAIMEGAKFFDINSSLQSKAAKINAEIEIINPSMSLRQIGPWNVKITLSSTTIIKDKSNLVSWNKTQNISALIPIENFEDPLYLINTNGLVTNKITKTPYTTFVQGNDVSNLYTHSQNSYYTNSTLAPSFLDRLEGKTSASPHGIESLVNLAKLSLQGITIQDKSVVDYIYFSSQNPAACNVQPSGMPAWFKLDNSHLTTYQVSCAP